MVNVETSSCCTFSDGKHNNNAKTITSKYDRNVLHSRAFELYHAVFRELIGSSYPYLKTCSGAHLKVIILKIRGGGGISELFSFSGSVVIFCYGHTLHIVCFIGEN